MTKSTQTRHEALAIVFGAIAVALWATSASAFELTLRHASVVQLLLGASISTVLVLGLILTMTGRLRATLRCSRRDWRRSILLGLFNPAFYYLVLLEAYDRLPGQHAVCLNYTWPIMFTLLAWPFLGRRPSLRQFAAVVICFVGVAVTLRGANVQEIGRIDALGVALALASAVLWALYWMCCMAVGGSGVEVLFRAFLAGAVLLVPVALVTGGLRPMPWQALTGMAYVGATEMGLAFVLWFRALALTENPARVATLAYLSPVISFLLLNAIVRERIQPASMVGLGLVLAGLALQSLRSKPVAPAVVNNDESLSTAEAS